MPKNKKRWIFWLSPLLLLLAAVLVARAKVNSLRDGAEQLAGTGRAAIALLKEYAAGVADLDVERVVACYGEDYASPAEGAWVEELRSERDGVRVYDWRSGEPRPYAKADVRRQVAATLDRLGSLQESKFKLGRVEEIASATEARIRATLWLRGERDGELFETQARFRMWLAATDGRWTIERQELLGGVTVRGPGEGFGDVAASAGLDFDARRNPLFATPEWTPERFGILKYGSAGVSAADYDGDGWYDLFFADGASSRLYRNTGSRGDGPGTFEEVTAEAGLPVDLPGINVALFVDFDNDGDQDLFLGRFMEGNLLFRNDGTGDGGAVRFTDVGAGAGLGKHFVVVATAADYDGDGDVDLYLGRYLDPRVELPTTLFYTRNSEGNSLLRNDGDLRFTDVTEEAGVREGGLTLGVSWADYDADGDPDLYVANDFGRNALLRNDGPGAGGAVRFSDVSAEAGALDFGFGMSATWGDVDNDGDFDIYVSNVHSGQRWYGQAATLYQYLLTSIKQGTMGEDFPLYKEIYGYAGSDWHDYGDRMVKGNSLLLNDGGRFTEVAETAGANPFGWYWGSTFLDYDNDGRLDVYAANGWISGKTHDDL